MFDAEKLLGGLVSSNMAKHGGGMMLLGGLAVAAFEHFSEQRGNRAGNPDRPATTADDRDWRRARGWAKSQAASPAQGCEQCPEPLQTAGMPPPLPGSLTAVNPPGSGRGDVGPGPASGRSGPGIAVDQGDDRRCQGRRPYR